jgi:lipoyl(octanoyl) transferase
VRRPTGGRAILHTDELTYSLTLPIGDDLAAGTVIDSYRRISNALIAGLSCLGVQPGADRRTEPSAKLGPVCFEIPSHYEITVDGRKLVGSAQLRRQAGILQHGSLPLCGDVTRICDVLAYPDEATRATAKSVVLARAITLSDALGTTIAYENVVNAIVAGFAETFAVDFIQYSLTPDEQSHADQLTADVYANPDWTHHR